MSVLVEDLNFSQYTSNEGFAEDLSEGKFSFPVVHDIHADTSNRQIPSTLLPILSSIVLIPTST